MALNKIQDGEIVTVIAPWTVASGGPVLSGGIFGAAQFPALVGASVEVAREGVYAFPKADSVVISKDDLLYFNPAEGARTLTNVGAGGLSLVGVANAAAAADDETVECNIYDQPVPYASTVGPEDGVTQTTGSAADARIMVQDGATGRKVKASPLTIASLLAALATAVDATGAAVSDAVATAWGLVGGTGNEKVLANVLSLNKGVPAKAAAAAPAKK